MSVALEFLLDTNVVSAPVSREPNPRVVACLERHEGRCAIAAPVWHELRYGCARLPRGKRRRALESYLRDVLAPSFEILPYDAVAAAWHGLERARLERAGKAAPYVDGQIAAVAYTAGLTLVTANTRDFARFQGLSLEDWSKRAR